MNGLHKRDLAKCRIVVMVGSYLYYHKDETWIEDADWIDFSKAIVKINEWYNNDIETLSIGVYDDYFLSENWDVNTGFDVPVDDPEILKDVETLTDVEIYTDRGHKYWGNIEQALLKAGRI